MSDGDEYVPINADIRRLTPDAVQIRDTANNLHWIPRKLIFGPHETELSEKIGQLTELKVFRWFVRREGISTTRVGGRKS